MVVYEDIPADSDALLAAMEELRQRLHDAVGDVDPVETLAERLQQAESISSELDRLIVRYMQLQPA